MVCSLAADECERRRQIDAERCQLMHGYHIAASCALRLQAFLVERISYRCEHAVP